MAGGLPEAVPIWERFETSTRDIPPGLSLFDLSASNQFGLLWKKHFPIAVKDDAKFVETDWESRYPLVHARTVFDLWGKWVLEEKSTDPAFTCMGYAARIYARLPPWKLDHREGAPGAHKSSSLFYPRSSLPNKDLVAQWGRIAEDLNQGGSGGCEVVSASASIFNAMLTSSRAQLEFLMDRIHHVWSAAGSGNTATCNANWYGSGRGTYRLMMHFFQSEELGCVEARLTAVS